MAWVSFVAVFAVAMTIAGIGLAAMVRPMASPEMWQTLSTIGQAFGVAALLAVVVTFGVQHREARRRRAELQLQREALLLAQRALSQTAAADLRQLHIRLVEMAIHDPDLADVWPQLEAAVPYPRMRQYLYANLILQHLSTTFAIGDISKEHAKATIRYVFRSPLMREYWINSVVSIRRCK